MTEPEPVFIVRAYHKVSGSLIRCFAGLCQLAGSMSKKEVEETIAQANKMDEWRKKHRPTRWDLEEEARKKERR